jgi:hypothetical protein
MGPAPIVAPVIDSTRGYTGASVAVDLHALGEGIGSGNWVEAGIGALGTAAEGASAIIDPIGTLAGWGAGWAMEHVEPLRDALDKLTGNPDEVSAYAQTWRNVASSTDSASNLYEGDVKADITSWQDAAGNIYRNLAKERVEDMEGLSAAATTMSKLAEAMNMVCGLVRAGVKFIISWLVGKLISLIIQALASFGFALPACIAQGAAAASQAISKVTKIIKDLFASLKKLHTMLNEMKKLVWAIQAARVGLGVAANQYRYKPYEA